MLQSLLADRFKLKVSQNSRVLPAYALMVCQVVKIKLKSAKPGEDGDLRGGAATWRQPQSPWTRLPIT